MSAREGQPRAWWENPVHQRSAGTTYLSVGPVGGRHEQTTPLGLSGGDFTGWLAPRRPQESEWGGSTGESSDDTATVTHGSHARRHSGTGAIDGCQGKRMKRTPARRECVPGARRPFWQALTRRKPRTTTDAEPDADALQWVGGAQCAIKLCTLVEQGRRPTATVIRCRLRLILQSRGQATTSAKIATGRSPFVRGTLQSTVSAAGPGPRVHVRVRAWLALPASLTLQTLLTLLACWLAGLALRWRQSVSQVSTPTGQRAAPAAARCHQSQPCSPRDACAARRRLVTTQQVMPSAGTAFNQARHDSATVVQSDVTRSKGSRTKLD